MSAVDYVFTHIESDFTLPFSPAGTKLDASTRNKNHYLSVTDIISEGPILGLPKSAASIYLDNAPAGDGSQSGHLLSDGEVRFTLNGTTSVTVPTGTNLDNWTTTPENGTKFLQILDRKIHATANAVRESVEENIQIKITATGAGASTFFEDWMVWDLNEPGPRPFLELSMDGVRHFIGPILSFSNAEAIVTPEGGTLHTKYLDKTDGSYKIHIHSSVAISTIVDDAITLNSAVDVPTGTFYGDLSKARYESSFINNNVISDTSKYKGFGYQFRTGKAVQPPISDIYQGSGATSISTAPGLAFEYKDAEPSEAQAHASGLTGDWRWPYVNTGADFGTRIEKTASQLNLSTATARQVDEIHVAISYPGGLIAKNHEGTEWYEGLQAYLYEINIDRGDGEGFTGWQNIREDGEFFYHTGGTTNPFFIQDDLSLERFKPFKTFKLGFTKATRDDINPTSSGTYETNRMNVSLKSTLTTITCVIRERFTYPYTAYANIRVSAETFAQIPKRSYLCRGRKILVPSNYITREESGGEASYKRNITTGEIESEDQDWDGDFRINIYTDNPAWVFYDMLTNSRYGLGEWLIHEDIDKYALYRIAKYCDEMVPDGKGGTEPRFRANIYLSKKAETYKVLKDMATTFRSILYWSEGSIIPVVDQAKDPIYNFTKGNIINGIFKYEGTGSKLRSNQVAVTWNNPENDYTPEVLLVEDRENIVKTSKIITEEAVAFGCTSIGQATRYGRWKLWTAINQSEVVSFKTAINATLISPGDIVNIQDADRYDVSYSGRISNTQDETQELIVKLDRDVTLDFNSTYTLSVLVDGAVAYLAQDGDDIGDNTETKTKIDGDLYERGDIIDTSLYADEEEASDLKDVNNKIVQIQWSPHNHVETENVIINLPVGSVIISNAGGGYLTAPTVNIAAPSTGVTATATATVSGGAVTAITITNPGNGYTSVPAITFSGGGGAGAVATAVLGTVNSLEVDTAFSTSPLKENIWLLKEIQDELTVAGSAKMYKILSIKEEKKNEFGIQAVEHYNEKFDAVDKDFGRPYVDTLLYPSTFVPPPTNLLVEIL
tara:strand:+ start:651 stop:3845 length:3195 start_codon:yes stop_codon:yes gene_type:complete